MREAILIWSPLYDRAVELFLETVDGETPRLRTTVDGQLARGPNGNPVIEGGWPCANFPAGWADRARSLLADYERERRGHRLSRKPEKPKENFARLRAHLGTAAEDPGAMNRRDVGMIRKILASYVTKHGEPGSSRHTEARNAQARNAALPGHHELARILAERLSAEGGDGGVRDIDACLAPLSSAEALSSNAPEGAELPSYLTEKAMRAYEAPVETLVERSVVRSSEAIAALVPHLTARTRATAIEEPELRGLYGALYEAFRRRRSLLLLDLEHQVQFHELPWVRALTPWTGSDAESRRSARTTMARVTRRAIESFPYTILPNKLILELRTLASTAGEQLPLVDELAADIFMGTFSASYLRAAQAAVPTLTGTLYELYYGLPLVEVSALDDVQKTRYGTPESPGFAALCVELAGVDPTEGWSVARNGMIIEQAQILTTHNLVQLTTGLGLVVDMRHELPELARRSFSSICQRQQAVGGDWRAEMQAVKNAAYAWRQMIVFLTLADGNELRPFLDWARGHLAEQTDEFRNLFEPAITGLVTIAEGGEFDQSGAHPATGGRRFLGWTSERHWLLRERRRSIESEYG